MRKHFKKFTDWNHCFVFQKLKLKTPFRHNDTTFEGAVRLFIFLLLLKAGRIMRFKQFKERNSEYFQNRYPFFKVQPWWHECVFLICTSRLASSWWFRRKLFLTSDFLSRLTNFSTDLCLPYCKQFLWK